MGKVAFHKALMVTGAVIWHSLFRMVAILDFVHTGHRRSSSIFLRWFLKTLCPYLTPCQIAKTSHQVHDHPEFPLSYIMIQTKIVLNVHRRLHRRRILKLEDVVKSVAQALPTLRAVPVAVASDGPVSDAVRLTQRHFPIENPPSGGKEHPFYNPSTTALSATTRAGRQAGANRTAAKSKRKSTRFMCGVCKKHLCPAPSFQEYHTIKN